MSEKNQAIETDDPTLATQHVGDVFCHHTLKLAPGSKDFRLNLKGLTFGDLRIYQINYGDGVHIIPDTPSNFSLVQIPLQGAGRDIIAGESVELREQQTGSVADFRQDIEMDWGRNCTKLVVYINNATLEKTAASLFSNSEESIPLALRHTLSLQSPELKSWQRILTTIINESKSGMPLANNSLFVQHLSDALVTGLVTTQWDGAAAVVDQQPVSKQGVDLALQLLHERPEFAWNVTELAHQSHMSQRSLSKAFTSQTGLTPLTYLRNLRLEGIRKDLLAANPETDTVTGVAGRWGVSHLGRFAGFYQERYGEVPSETLKRS